MYDEQLPDDRRSMKLCAMEIADRFLQNSNGLPTMCSMALLSKLMAVNVGEWVGVEPLHKTLKN